MSEKNQMKGAESQVTSHCENPTLQITTVKLDGPNYLAWSQFALLSIKSRGKMGYLNGKIQEPKLDGCYIPSSQKSVKDTCFFAQRKRFGMLLLKHIPK
jgi:hypothetical protein